MVFVSGRELASPRNLRNFETARSRALIAALCARQRILLSPDNNENKIHFQNSLATNFIFHIKNFISIKKKTAS